MNPLRWKPQKARIRVPTSTTAYYDATAREYDRLHGDNEPEHTRALERGWPLLDRLQIGSAVDVGCGTGRTLKWLQNQQPEIGLIGVDPSDAMLAIARNALPSAALHNGTGERIPLDDDCVDLAVATGIMHHVDHPARVIAEMFRVARKAVLISDHNNFAFGGQLVRRLRMGLHVCGLLNAFTFVKQGFRLQGYSEGDGWWYPYSLLDNHADIARFSDDMYLLPTRVAVGVEMRNLAFTQSHFAVAAIKRTSLKPSSVDCSFSAPSNESIRYAASEAGGREWA